MCSPGPPVASGPVRLTTRVPLPSSSGVVATRCFLPPPAFGAFTRAYIHSRTGACRYAKTHATLKEVVVVRAFGAVHVYNIVEHTRRSAQRELVSSVFLFAILNTRTHVHLHTHTHMNTHTYKPKHKQQTGNCPRPGTTGSSSTHPKRASACTMVQPPLAKGHTTFLS